MQNLCPEHLVHTSHAWPQGPAVTHLATVGDLGAGITAYLKAQLIPSRQYGWHTAAVAFTVE